MLNNIPVMSPLTDICSISKSSIRISVQKGPRALWKVGSVIEGQGIATQLTAPRQLLGFLHQITYQGIPCNGHCLSIPSPTWLIPHHCWNEFGCLLTRPLGAHCQEATNRSAESRRKWGNTFMKRLCIESWREMTGDVTRISNTHVSKETKIKAPTYL